MAEKTMKIQFKTLSKGGGKIEPAGKIHVVSEEKGKEYISRGLAVEYQPTPEEKADAEKAAAEKAAAEKAAAEKAAAEKAAAEKAAAEKATAEKAAAEKAAGSR